MLAAALLHDVVEDSELEVADVRERCGDRVAEIVEALTDDASIEPYEQRKREHRDRVAAAGHDAIAIYAADKLTNVSMLRRLLRADGESGRRASSRCRSTRRSRSGSRTCDLLRERRRPGRRCLGELGRISSAVWGRIGRAAGRPPEADPPRSGNTYQSTANMTSAAVGDHGGDRRRRGRR